MVTVGQYVFEFFAIVIPLTVAALRFYALRNRLRTTIALFIDFLFLLGLCMVVAAWCLVMYNLIEGQRFMQTLSPEEAQLALLSPKFLKLYYCETIFYLFELWSLKFCFLLYFYSFVKHLSKKAKAFLVCATIYSLATLIMNMIILFVSCKPIPEEWNAGLAACTPVHTVLSASISYATNITSDLMIVMMPTFLVRALNLRTKDIYALAFVYLVGFMTIAASTIRYSVLYKWIVHPELSQNAVDSQQNWATVEIVTALIAFCLPSFRAALRKSPKLPIYSSSANTGTQQSGKLGIDVSRTFTVRGESESELVSMGIGSNASKVLEG